MPVNVLLRSTELYFKNYGIFLRLSIIFPLGGFWLIDVCYFVERVFSKTLLTLVIFKNIHYDIRKKKVLNNFSGKKLVTAEFFSQLILSLKRAVGQKTLNNIGIINYITTTVLRDLQKIKFDTILNTNFLIEIY